MHVSKTVNSNFNLNTLFLRNRIYCFYRVKVMQANSWENEAVETQLTLCVLLVQRQEVMSD